MTSGGGIWERVQEVRRRIAQAASRAGRDRGDVALIAVTKTVSVARIREAIGAGITLLGENRVQEARDKVSRLNVPDVRWHLVGHLQTNKSKVAVQLFDLIHTLDSLRLAAVLDRHGAEAGKTVRVLVEVNLAEEPEKSGIRKDDLDPLLQGCRALAHVAVEGLMAIPPFRADPEDVRPFFQRLRTLRDAAARSFPDCDLRHLSMGMSHDFEVAIEEGATMVRIGTAIFGERPQL
jgi:pyridoxal phosphate enzyme (YggS family)